MRAIILSKVTGMVAVLLGDQATAEDITRVQKLYGLDQPLPVQFGYWLREVLQGNLGQSIFLQRPVTQALAERAEPTTFLAIMAVAIAAGIGIPCGIVSAVYRGRVVDQVFTGVAMLGASIPSFWLGLVLMQFFAMALGWFPVSGYGAPGAPLAERLHALVLPATVLGLTVALMIGGAVVTETVFGLPGVGNLVVNAVLRRDYPVIQGALLVIAAIYVVINFLIDLLYAVVDPRVKV